MDVLLVGNIDARVLRCQTIRPWINSFLRFSRSSPTPGFRLRDAAVEIGMAPGNLSKILNGKERVTFDRAERIANRLGQRFLWMKKTKKSRNVMLRYCIQYT